MAVDCLWWLQNSAYILLPKPSYYLEAAMNVAHRSKPLKWVVADEPDATLVDELSAATGIPKNVVKILINRGSTSSSIPNCPILKTRSASRA